MKEQKVATWARDSQGWNQYNSSTEECLAVQLQWQKWFGSHCTDHTKEKIIVELQGRSHILFICDIQWGTKGMHKAQHGTMQTDWIQRGFGHTWVLMCSDGAGWHSLTPDGVDWDPLVWIAIFMIWKPLFAVCATFPTWIICHIPYLNREYSKHFGGEISEDTRKKGKDAKTGTSHDWRSVYCRNMIGWRVVIWPRDFRFWMKPIILTENLWRQMLPIMTIPVVL